MASFFLGVAWRDKYDKKTNKKPHKRMGLREAP